jgi:Polyketide cyclase / dehydrase and lipid transport
MVNSVTNTSKFILKTKATLSIEPILNRESFEAAHGERFKTQIQGDHMSFQTTVFIGVAAIATLGLVLLMLPANKRIERSKLINSSPEAVFALLSTTSGFQKMNPYRDEEPNIKISAIGPNEGIGAGFAFEGKEVQGTQTITALEPNASVTMQIDLGAMGKPVQTFRLSKEIAGTRVTWTTDNSFGYNPVARVVGLFLEKMVGPTYERGLNNLERVLSAPANAF